MCYAIPGKVKGFDGRFVIVDYFGEERRAHNEFDDLKIGDYIYAQGGYAIKKIPQDDAEVILSVWKETFFDLQEVDLQLSKIEMEKEGINPKVLSLLDKVNQGLGVKPEEFELLLSSTDKKEIELIIKNANFLRQKHHKNACCVHGIIEISNDCSRNCTYCGISTHNKNINKYTMSGDEIFEAAKNAIDEYGFKALVLQSGENTNINIKEIAKTISRIRYDLGALIFISFGEVGIDNLKLLYEAGARGILLRFETSNPKLYEELHPGHSLKSRIEHIKVADKLGYLVATGGLIGAPGQTNKDIINDIYLAKELNAEMFSFGPFVPHPETPLAMSPISSEEEILKTLAIARFIDQEKAKILITTAFETICPSACKKGLLAGANSVMLNVTPDKYRKLYSIYPDRAHQDEPIQTQIDQTIGTLKSLGRAPTDLGVAT